MPCIAAAYFICSNAGMAVFTRPEEIEKLRECGRRHAQILAEVAAMVRPGLSTKEIDDAVRSKIAAFGDIPSFLGYTPDDSNRPYPAACNVSINEEIVHGIPNEHPRILKEGDIVSIDVGLNHKGVFTDSALTVPVGKVDAQSERLMAATKRALWAGISAITPGATIGDIGYAIEKVAKAEKFALAEGLCGHGVGKKVHEEPYVPNEGRRGKGLALKPGMVLAIEPMLNAGTGGIVHMADGYTYRTADNKRSAHFEHTILVTESGVEVITDPEQRTRA